MQKIELFQQTIDAWLTKDVKKLLTVLSEDVIILSVSAPSIKEKLKLKNGSVSGIILWKTKLSHGLWINIMWIMRLLYSHGLSGVFMKVKKAFLMEFLLLNFPEIKFVKFKNLNKSMKNFGHF